MAFPVAFASAGPLPMQKAVRWRRRTAAGLRRLAVRTSAVLLALLVALSTVGGLPLGAGGAERSSRGPALALTGDDLFDSLQESGYLMPFLGFVFVCLLMIRFRGPSRSEQPPLAGVPANGDREFQVPMGMMLVPVDSQFAPPAPAAEAWDEEVCRQTTYEDDNQVTPQDFKALLDRAHHDDSLVEGIAHLRQGLLGQGDDNWRPGLMSARKVLEIQRILVQELEDSFFAKVGFIASCFHRWRCEAMTLHVGRRYEEDFDRQKGEWEAYLNSHEKTYEQKVLDAARKAHASHERNQKVAALLLDRWAHGEATALARSSLCTWRDEAARRHKLNVQRKQVGCVVHFWAEGGRRGSVHVCYKSWLHQMRKSREAMEKDKEFEASKRSWERFFEEEQAKLRNKLDGALERVDEKKARAEQDVQLALSKWEMGIRAGVLALALQTWCMHAAKAQRLQRQQRSVQRAVMELCGGQVAGTARSCLACWKSFAQHQVVVQDERQKWEAQLSSERMKWKEEDDRWESEDARRVAAARAVVDLALRKWHAGNVSGLLSEVWRAWWGDAKRQHASAVARKGAHSAVHRWLEGERLGNAHTCFLHWKVHAELTQTAVNQEQELLEKRRHWEELLAVERQRCQGEAELAAEVHENRRKQAHAVVELALSKWEMGNREGLVQQAILAWRESALDARRKGRQRQAVHASLLKSFVGKDRGRAQMSFLNWKNWTRQVLATLLGEKRLSEEKKKWDEFLENEQKAHAESLQQVHTKAEQRRAEIDQAIALTLQKWRRGDVKGLVATSFQVWRQMAVASASINCGKRSVHMVVLRFFGGDQRGAAYGFFLTWKHWVKMELLMKREVRERQRKISQLEERSERLVSSKQTRLLKYAGVLGTCSEPALVVMVLAAWRQHSAGLKSAEIQRQLEVALQEQKRAHELIDTRRKQLSVATMRLLGHRDQTSLLMDSMLAWSRYKQERKQAWAHQLAHSEILKKYAWYVQCLVSRESDSSLLAACFWELLREAKSQRHHREREEVLAKCAEMEEQIMAFDEERSNIDEQLRTAYRQIDNITETLQKELKTKEELATELREAYDKLRQQSMRREVRQVLRPPMSSAASSISEASELPHLPATAFGLPGNNGVNLQEPLVNYHGGPPSRNRSPGSGARTPANWSNAAERLFVPKR